MDSDHKVKVHVHFHDDGCAVIQFDQGQNRINLPFVKAFNKALDEVERNKDCKVLITTGKGKFYSNGLDLEWMSKNQDKVPEMQELMYTLTWRLTRFPLPTVAAINGHAFAGGAIIAIMHDYRVMNSKRGWFCFNEIQVGRRFPSDAVQLLQYKMTSKMLRDAILYAKRYTGPEAMADGFVDKISDPDNLIETAKQVGLDTIGKNVLDREMLHIIKKDMFPEKLPNTPKL